MNEEKTAVSVTLVGNPDTGKTAVFTGLTGIPQNTESRHDKTEAKTQGEFFMNHQTYLLTLFPDACFPVTCSEAEKSAWEKDCPQKTQMILMTCDAARLERDLNLLKKIISQDFIKDNNIPLVLCINFCDESEKKGIEIDLRLLEDVLQIPVLGFCSRCPSSLNQIRQAMIDAGEQNFNYDCLDFCPRQLARETIRSARF